MNLIELTFYYIGGAIAIYLICRLGIRYGEKKNNKSRPVFEETYGKP